ncbi:hypothetical protein ACLOJK_034427, partial [Asimina triloba]
MGSAVLKWALLNFKDAAHVISICFILSIADLTWWCRTRVAAVRLRWVSDHDHGYHDRLPVAVLLLGDAHCCRWRRILLPMDGFSPFAVDHDHGCRGQSTMLFFARFQIRNPSPMVGRSVDF